MSGFKWFQLTAFAVLGLVLLLLLIHACRGIIMLCIRRCRPEVMEKKPFRRTDYPKNLTLLKELSGGFGRIFKGEAVSERNLGQKQKSQAVSEPTLTSVTLNSSRNLNMFYRKDSQGNSSVASALTLSADGSSDSETPYVVVRIDSDGDSTPRYLVINEEDAEFYEVVYNAYYSDNHFTRFAQLFSHDVDDDEMSTLKVGAKRYMPGSIVVFPFQKRFYSREKMNQEERITAM